MKAIINKAKFNRNTTVCALVVHYDENGNYAETVFENIELKDIPNSIKDNIDFIHDITLQVEPNKEVRVFAKNVDDIHTYYKSVKDNDTLRVLLEDYIIWLEPPTEYIWTSFDLDKSTV